MTKVVGKKYAWLECYRVGDGILYIVMYDNVALASYIIADDRTLVEFRTLYKG